MKLKNKKQKVESKLTLRMDIAQLFTYLFILHSLTIYPLFPTVTLLLTTINL